MTQPRYGKHRGRVVENIDPMARGRLLVSVPSVFGTGTTNWAEPCVPYAGPGVGWMFLPPKDAHVWVEFVEGNTQEPIWTGCYWAPGEAESLLPLPSNFTLRTPSFAITSVAAPGMEGKALVTIEHAGGHKITMDPVGITVSNGKAEIKLTGPSVTINRDGLEVL